MSHLMQPVFGDLMLYGVAAAGWLFIFALIGNAWWEKRQTRLLREQALGQFKRPVLVSFFQRWRRRTLIFGLIVVAVVMLSRIQSTSTNHVEDSGPTPLAKYVAHFHGKAPFSVSSVQHSVEAVFTNLWDEPVLKARTLDLAVNTNFFDSQNTTQMDRGNLKMPPR